MFYYGAAYYPEQETATILEADLKLLQEIGFNVVRIGEFAWSHLEPEEGRSNWSWLDEIIARLGNEGIHTLICTPTACPPRWMIDRHPEILYQDHRGITRPFGGRRHYCYNAPAYRQHCQRIAAALGERYGRNPHVLGFHLDNELAQEATGRCHCPACRLKFRQWLEARYQTINRFNQSIGATFWGQDYQSFAQIDPPLRSIEESADAPLIEAFVDNPTLRLEWERFCSTSIIEFLTVQQDELRRHTDKPLTTNGTGIGTNGVDYYKCFADLDVVAGDIYPSLRTDAMYGTTTDYAFHRGIKPGKGFWVAETSSGGGQGVWSREGVLQPYPGTLRQNAVHAFACGAELLTYFQWRSFRYGAEQLEAACLNIDGIPDRRFAEFQAASRDIRSLTPLLTDTQINNQIAICFDYDTHWAIRIKPFKRGYDYRDHLHAVATPLARQGWASDVVSYAADWSAYRVVFLVAPLIMDEPFKAKIRNYVAQGGILVSTFLTAIKDTDNHAIRAAIPAGLTDLFGMRILEGEPVFNDTARCSVAEIQFQISGHSWQGTNRWWTEVLETQGAEVIGRYANTFRAQQPVMSRHKFGKGMAYYLGTWLEGDAMYRLLDEIVRHSGVRPSPITGGTGVEVITRQRAGGGYVYFVFNYCQAVSSCELKQPMTTIPDGRKVSGQVGLQAKEYLILV